jgi:ATP-dependent Clp protease ATP-binding subunit ClpA|tara:strand:- start:1686 stop:2021 length:336 start_codon:yes stop_codon:yes gene_type:complete
MKDSKFNEIRSSLDESSDDYEMSGSSSSSKKSKSETPVLDAYSRDLTKLAEDDVLDPIIGREKEINRVCQILARRKKNNPILLGEPGCVDAETIITVRKKSNNNTHNIVNT